MSIFKVESAAFTYIATVFNEYGIPIEFRQDDSLDLLTEYRRSIRLRMENQDTFQQLVDSYSTSDDSAPNNKRMHNLGLYSRSPIRKSKMVGNNRNLEVLSKDIQKNYGIEIRNAFYGEMDFEVTLLLDTHEIADLIELTYIYNLSGQKKTVDLDYNLGSNLEPLTEVGYSLEFSDINSRGTFNSTNMFHVDFSVSLSGLFFLPFYKESYLLEDIVISVHVMNAETDPIPKNITSDSLVYSEHYPQPQNK